MFKKILIFSLYFYFAGQWVDADEEEQLQSQSNEILNTYNEELDNDVSASKLVRITSTEKTSLPYEANISFTDSVSGESVTLQLYLLERNVMSRDLECWIMNINKTTGSFNLQRMYRNAFLLEGLFYQSLNPRGVFFSSRCGDNRLYYGVYGEGENQRVIEPLPNTLQYENIEDFANHIEYTSNPVIPTPTAITIPVPSESLESLQNQLNRRTPLKNLYPKLLLIIDGAYYTKFKNVSSIVRYLSLFWNFVRLRYDEVSSPKIEPIITGIIIARNEDTLEDILTKNSAVDSTYKDANYTLQQYYYSFKLELAKKLDQFKNYDSSLLMTPYEGYYYNGPTEGLSNSYSICQNVIAYTTDSDINFKGINIVIRELAHLLGAYLDKFNLYGSWTDLSIKSFEIFAQKERASCLSDP